MCLSNVRVRSKKSLLQLHCMTWDMSFETWDTTDHTHHYNLTSWFLKLFLQKTLVNCQILIHHKCSSQHTVRRSFLFTLRGQPTEIWNDYVSSLKWEKASKLLDSLTLTKMNSATKSSVMTIVAQHRPSILNFQVESDCSLALEGQDDKQCLFQLKNRRRHAFDCWKVSLLGTMPSDYIHQHELKCDRGGAPLHVVNQAYKQAMWLPFDQNNIHTQSISALNFTVSSQVMSMSCQGIAVSGNQCHIKLNQGCNRFTQFNSQAAAGESWWSCQFGQRIAVELQGWCHNRPWFQT